MVSDADSASLDRRLDHRAFAALATAAAAGVSVALAVQVAPRLGRQLAARRKRRSLIIYLRDHLSGSDAAIQVVRRLANSQEFHTDLPFFRRLSSEFQRERDMVRALLIDLGASSPSPKRAAGQAAGALLSVAAGGKPGDLSLLRTLEALAIAVQGKRCLWRALHAIGPSLATDHRQFLSLEAQAIRQWEELEARRCALAPATFPDLLAQGS